MAKCDYCGTREAQVELLERVEDKSVGYIGHDHIANVCKKCGEDILDTNNDGWHEQFQLGEEI